MKKKENISIQGTIYISTPILNEGKIPKLSTIAFSKSSQILFQIKTTCLDYLFLHSLRFAFFDVAVCRFICTVPFLHSRVRKFLVVILQVFRYCLCCFFFFKLFPLPSLPLKSFGAL